MGKVISQKKYIKGLNVGTGILTEPQGTIVRISNLAYIQRGSLQTVDGSAIIGQLVAPGNVARAMGVYYTQTSGQYPYYPTLCTPPSYLTPDPFPVIVTLTTGGVIESAGTYAFAVVVTDPSGVFHSDALKSIGSIVNDGTGPRIFTISGWTANPNLQYTLYYLPGGVNATQGVLIQGPSQGVNQFQVTTLLPTTPLVTLPSPNNSYNYNLQIGNVVPPSKQVLFSLVNGYGMAGFPPQPAAVAPGDPTFQFSTGFSQVAQLSVGASGIAGSTQAGAGTNFQTSTPTPAFSSQPISGQTVTYSLGVSFTLQATNGFPLGGVSIVNFQYSPDSGTTWINFWTLGENGTSFSNIQTISITLQASAVANLSTVLFRVMTQATCNGSGTYAASGQINSVQATLTLSKTFTPYGGVIGYVEPIPQILQFAQKAILILGNGVPPAYLDPSQTSSATVTSLINTFQASYPSWQASVAWVVGNSIAVLISSVNYQFTAIQQGVSASSMPTFTAGLGSTVTDGQVIWKNVGPITTSIAPRGAAHGIVYAGSLWLFNTYPSTTTDQLDGPTCLKMSDTNNFNSWNPVNVAFLGKDDGTQGTGLASFTIAEVGIAPTESLVAFKEYSTWQIIGVFGAQDFSIQQAQTSLGCLGARSIQFLPGYGIVRLTHMGFAIFDGVKDTLISEEIRPYLFGGTANNSDLIGIDWTFCYLSQSLQVMKPPMYVCMAPLVGSNGSMTRMFVYDMVLKAWTICDLPWAISTLMTAYAGEGTPLPIATRSDLSNGFGTGIVERLFSGDVRWDDSSLVPSLPGGALGNPSIVGWTYASAHVFRDGSSTRGFYRRATIRGELNTAVLSAITITVQVNGNPFSSYQTFIQPQPNSNQFELDIDLMFTAQQVQIKVSGTGSVVIDAIDWDVTEKKGGRILIG